MTIEHDEDQRPLIVNAKCPEEWRINREVRFTWRQQRAREWISFREIAEWISELDGRGVPNEAARANAYDMLMRDLLAGYFGAGSKTQVLYLHYRTKMARMTRQRLSDVLDTFALPDVRSEYLARCWIARRMFERWLARHNLPLSPARFEPHKSVSSTAESANLNVTKPLKPKQRPGPRPGKLRRFEAADRALFPELEMIMATRLISRSAAARMLAEQGKIEGVGISTPESRARRLAALHAREKAPSR